MLTIPIAEGGRRSARFWIKNRLPLSKPLVIQGQHLLDAGRASLVRTDMNVETGWAVV